MTNLPINIISTEKDIDLFTNHEYYQKVKKALDELKKEYTLTKEHQIACYDNHISLYRVRELILIREL